MLAPVFVVGLMCSSTSTLADTIPAPLKLNGQTGKFNLRGHLALYEDKTGDETIATIQQKRFHAVPEAAPSLGFTNSVYWIKLVLENDTAKIRTVVLELPNQFLDFVDMFVISDWTSTVERYHGGARVPWADRTSQGRYPLVYLYFAPHEQKTIYVRVQSRTPLRVPLGLWTEEGYSSAALAEYLLLGLFFGALLFLIIYSLLTWSILRQRAYLYYILTIAGVCIFQLGYSGLFPPVTIFSRPEAVLHLLTAGIGLTFIFNIIFVSSFMDARAKYPVLHSVLDIFLIGAVVSLILYVFDYYIGNPFAMIYGPLLGCALAVVVGLMWYWGESHARYLFLAHIQFPILAWLYVAFMAGFLPYSKVLEQSARVAYLWQGLFFALALADRYSMMPQSFRQMLEQQVEERSAELVEANVNLENEIMERRRVQAAIERAKQEWEQTFDTVPDLIALVDRNHTILRINKAMADKMNMHPRDAIGRNCYDVCHGTSEPIATCPLQQSLHDGQEHTAEVVEPRLGGAFLVSVTPVPGDDEQPQMFVHVAQDITDRKLFETQLRKLAVTDSLTNVWNRRYFMSLAGRELERIRRYGGRLALVMIDLDHFKVVNDTYGHDVGDQVLRKVAQITGSALRKVDIFARYGGEEFVIALPETGLQEALLVADRLRESIASTPMADGGKPLHITVSIGIAVAGPDAADLATLLKQADTALYQAKNNGRNRVEVFVQQPAEVSP
jgi:diguanylate cyclase (GGDEF)-like protein/PAS domain S-box-containing protein